MFKRNDPNTFTKYFDLYSGRTDKKEEKELIGYLVAEYYIKKYDQLQAKDFNGIMHQRDQFFMVHCSQRIVIYNKEGLQVNPDENASSYDNYPALINTFINLECEADGFELQLLDLSPKTVNTQVQNSGSTGSDVGKTTTNSRSNTVGSSTAQTNSYGASVSVSLMDFSVSTNYEHSNTDTHEQSRTSGTDRANSENRNESETAAMSIKDWGSYSVINPENKNATWIFGQEYPWSAIDCRKTDCSKNHNNDSQVQLIIPDQMVARLFDGKMLYPPSQLSMFGVNFLMKGLWLVKLPPNASADISFNHEVNYFSASHCVESIDKTGSAPAKQVVNVYMDKDPVRLNAETLTTTVNLGALALDPLGTGSKEAILGFLPNKFMVKPEPASSSNPPVPFKSLADSNTLLVLDSTNYQNCGIGSGFKSSGSLLTGTFSQQCQTLSITAYFKVTNVIDNYSLFMKHWKIGTADIKLTITINNDQSNQIVKYIDSIESEGGEKNLLSIDLRDQNYSSVDYYDYIQLGLNSITISIEQIDGYVEGGGYQLRAMSVEAV